MQQRLQDALVVAAAPDTLGIIVVGFCIVWLCGVPFSDHLSLGPAWGGMIGVLATNGVPPFVAPAGAILAVMLVAWIAIFRSRILFYLLIGGFIASWLLWSGIVQNYSLLPWWRIFNIELPAPVFIADRMAKLFILILGSWTLISLYRFRLLRREFQKSGALAADLQRTFLPSTLVLVGSAATIGIVLFIFLAIIL